MLEDMGLEDVYSLFRWESDPSHASSIALGQTVAFKPTPMSTSVNGTSRGTG
jgi:hypothetical protein